MSTLAGEWAAALANVAELNVIAWEERPLTQPAFRPWCAASAATQTLRWKPDVLYLADAVMCAVGVPLGRAFGVPTVATVHGLDTTYPARWYQRTIVPLVGNCASVICASNHTSDECRQRGVGERATVVHSGLSLARTPQATESGRSALDAALGKRSSLRQVLLTVGRLVKRKGVARFIRDVLPRIVAQNPEVLYVVVGDGPEGEQVTAAAGEACMQDHVRIPGRVPDGVLGAAYERASIFVMPNQPVQGDAEGFGLVALEANLFGLPVVATAVDGLVDAVRPGANRYLVCWQDSEGFALQVNSLLASPARLEAAGARARRYALERCSPQAMAEEYLAVFREAVHSCDGGHGGRSD
jgi:phosphatidylinositol alpha-1,6-mannosyltransferase